MNFKTLTLAKTPSARSDLQCFGNCRVLGTQLGVKCGQVWSPPPTVTQQHVVQRSTSRWQYRAANTLSCGRLPFFGTHLWMCLYFCKGESHAFYMWTAFEQHVITFCSLYSIWKYEKPFCLLVTLAWGIGHGGWAHLWNQCSISLQKDT